MKRDAAVSILSGCAAELRDKFGVAELSLFGSVARDEAGDTSDVDVLVSFARRGRWSRETLRPPVCGASDLPGWSGRNG